MFPTRFHWNLCCSVVSDSFATPWTHGAHQDFPGKNTGVGCHFLLKGIFPTQGSTRVSLIASRFSGVWLNAKSALKRNGNNLYFSTVTWKIYQLLFCFSQVFSYCGSKRFIHSGGEIQRFKITWPASWETYMPVRKQQLELDMEQQTGFK